MDCLFGWIIRVLNGFITDKWVNFVEGLFPWYVKRIKWNAVPIKIPDSMLTKRQQVNVSVNGSSSTPNQIHSGYWISYVTVYCF